jgi:hypothetical protein
LKGKEGRLTMNESIFSSRSNCGKLKSVKRIVSREQLLILNVSRMKDINSALTDARFSEF